MMSLICFVGCFGQTRLSLERWSARSGRGEARRSEARRRAAARRGREILDSWNAFVPAVPRKSSGAANGVLAWNVFVCSAGEGVGRGLPRARRLVQLRSAVCTVRWIAFDARRVRAPICRGILFRPEYYMKFCLEHQKMSSRNEESRSLRARGVGRGVGSARGTQRSATRRSATRCSATRLESGRADGAARRAGRQTGRPACSRPASQPASLASSGLQFHCCLQVEQTYRSEPFRCRHLHPALCALVLASCALRSP